MNNDTTTQLALGQQPTINSNPAADIDMGALLDEWRLAKSYVDMYTRDFIQLDNIADGVPLNKDPDNPYVADTTIAGLVRSIPRDCLQQLPTFSVTINGAKNSVKALTATYLLQKYAFNESTFGKGLLSTLQMGAEEALKHGYAPFMVAAGSMFQDFGTTLRLLHFSDTAPEPGITDHNETGYDYMVANLTPSRVRRILRQAQNNPNTSWNIPALQRVLEAGPRAKTYSMYESAPRKNNAGEEAGPTYEFVTRYESGVADGTIITFCPEVSDMPLRVLESKSKFGYPRIMYLVIDPAPLTPFGISRVRLASPHGNLMNIYVANIAALLLLNSKPPIFKRGRFAKPVQLKMGAVWEGLDQNASADLKTLDNGALQQFPQISQQIVGQIMNLMGKRTGVLNSNAGDSGFGKTGPGIKAASDDDDNSANQITKVLENFLRQYALVALDTLLSEQEGEDIIYVDDDTMNAINQVAPGTVGADHKLKINWDEFYRGALDPNDPTGQTRLDNGVEDWSVDIDVSISKDQLEEKKRGDLQDMLTVIAQNAQAVPGASEKLAELSNMLMQDVTPTVAPASVVPPAPTAMPGMAQGMPTQPPASTPAVPAQ